MQKELTLRNWHRDLVNITIFSIQNQKLPTRRYPHRVRLNSHLTTIKQSLNNISPLKFNHGTGRNHCKIEKNKTPQINQTHRKHPKLGIRKRIKPVLEAEVIVHIQFTRAETALDKAPATISAMKTKTLKQR